MNTKFIFFLVVVIFTISCSRTSTELPGKNYGQDGNDISYNLYVDKTGNIWSSGKDSRTIDKLNYDFKVTESIKRPGTANLALVNDGTMWAFENYLLARSKDNGQTWECFSKSSFINCDKSVTEYNFQAIKSIVFNNGAYFLGTYDGIYRSLDNGDSWEKVYNGNQTGINHVFDMISHNGIVYASAQISSSNITYGIIETFDNGQSWKTLNVQYADADIPIYQFIGSSASKNIYAYVVPNIFLVNTGDEWKILSYLPVNGSSGHEQCDFKFSVVPNGDLLASCSIYTAKYEGGDFPTIRNKGAYLLKSSDGGKSWQEISINDKVEFVLDMAILPSGDLIAATNLGIVNVDYNK